MQLTWFAMSLALTAVLGAVAASVFRDEPAPPSGNDSPDQTCPEDRSQLYPRLEPGTYSEGGHTVMPIAFIDGTTAEFLYPPELGFERLVIQPVGHVSVEGKEAPAVGGTFTIRFRGGDPGLPASTEPDDDGGTRRIWEVEATSPDEQILSVRIGCWNADLRASRPVNQQRSWERTFERNLLGVETASGFLILRADPPLHVWGIGEYPAPPGMYLGDDVTLQPRCHEFTGETFTVEGVTVERESGFATWCDSGILVGVSDRQLAKQMIGSVSIRKVRLSGDDGS